MSGIEFSHANDILIAIGTNVFERWGECVEIKKGS